MYQTYQTLILSPFYFLNLTCRRKVELGWVHISNAASASQNSVAELEASDALHDEETIT